MKHRVKSFVALEERSAGRETMPQAIFNFIRPIMLSRCKPARLEGRKNNIRLIRELDSFNGLYFVWSASVKSENNGAVSPTGKNNIQISFGPSKDKRCLVFSADYWENTEKCEIHYFSEEPDWRRILSTAIGQIIE